MSAYDSGRVASPDAHVGKQKTIHVWISLNVSLQENDAKTLACIVAATTCPPLCQNEGISIFPVSDAEFGKKNQIAVDYDKRQSKGYKIYEIDIDKSSGSSQGISDALTFPVSVTQGIEKRDR